MPRTYDLVLFGASGFTGRRAAARLAERMPAGVRWAIAGRRRQPLEDLAATLSPTPDVLVADALDAEATAALAKDTRVLVSTAGPYAVLGNALVAGCAASGTHWCDITGEVPWIRDIVARHHGQARETGARIVPACGFDSIPSDLGALLTARALPQGQPIDVIGGFRLKGGLNGGTFATALHHANHRWPGPAALDAVPGAIHPPDRRTVTFDDRLASWTAPFVMAPTNTRVVRRSASLCAEDGAPWGHPFTYDEVALAKGRGRALALQWGLAAAHWASARIPALVRPWGPAPGDGPSESTIMGGHFAGIFVGTAANGASARTVFQRSGDPGNEGTTRMLAAAAIALLQGRGPGGVRTPANAFGPALADDLRADGFHIVTEVA